ncbi:hypothetical protein [Streptomyces sp. MNP-20]|uniref:hypothetical protein n=1 Tax=Streptomyces sp. MNP-20 TaxID=2721165 RepID=UPI0020A65F0E|nr:hypothetical protein [Streptomyces sp. MNP-20]
MDAPTRAAHCDAADAWLASSSPRPEIVREVWNMGGLAPLASGTHWLAVEAALTVTLSALQRIPTRYHGPLLVDASVQCAWWLVPADAAEHLADVRTLAVHPQGWILQAPSTRSPIGGRFWLELPDGTGRLTPADRLGAALGPDSPRLPAEALG